MNRRDLLKASIIATPGLTGGAAAVSTPVFTPSKTGKLRKGYVDGPFGQIHYYQQGAGVTLIMSHQSPVSARMFEKAMPLLASRGINAIAVDTPGYGNSDVPSAPPSIAEYADAYLSVLDDLGFEKAHFLGHHTGAGIFCNFAARYPERVSSLIMSGPPLFSPPDLERFSDMELAPNPVYRDGSHLQEGWDRRARYSPGWTDEVVMHRRLVDQLWAGDTSWYGHRAAFDYDMSAHLMSLKGRVLIMTNTGDDIYDLALNARRARPDFAYQELLGGTHDIVDEQPENWSNNVADFILA